MRKEVLFIHGAGEGAYKEDAALFESLQESLSPEYEVHYPAMPNEANAPYDLWKVKVEQEIGRMEEPIVLVGHSVGASHLAKMLSEADFQASIAGVFLLNTPFWGEKAGFMRATKSLNCLQGIILNFQKIRFCIFIIRLMMKWYLLAIWVCTRKFCHMPSLEKSLMEAIK